MEPKRDTGDTRVCARGVASDTERGEKFIGTDPERTTSEVGKAGSDSDRARRRLKQGESISDAYSSSSL